MNCPCNTTEPLPRLRAFFFGALAATIVALSLAAPASAETIEGAGAPPEVEVPAVPPGSDTGAVAAISAPVAAAPESAQVEETPSVPSPDVVTDSLPVAPTSGEEAGSVPLPVSAAVDRTLSRTGAIAKSTADAAGKVVEQAGVDTEVLPGPIRRPGDLLDSAVPTDDDGPAPAASNPGSTRPPASWSGSEPMLAHPALTPSAPVAGGPSPGGLLTAKAGGSAIEKTLRSLDPANQSMRAPAGPVADAGAPTSPSHDQGPTGGHTPPGFPSPTPDSPTSAVAGSGGTSFIPLAALLALLAPAAPAAMRRLRRPPDFQVPTGFVCALERPG